MAKIIKAEDTSFIEEIVSYQ